MYLAWYKNDYFSPLFIRSITLWRIVKIFLIENSRRFIHVLENIDILDKELLDLIKARY